MKASLRNYVNGKWVEAGRTKDDATGFNRAHGCGTVAVITGVVALPPKSQRIKRVKE
jgi:hypothetical protein